LIKTHPQIGYEILKSIDFSGPVAEIVLQHHERVDGSGYPQGLSGSDILVEAQILGVADLIESMSSRRPYRAAYGIDSALEEIEGFRNVLYDSKVVDACVKLLREEEFSF
jgi:HD-GYP domain-containing protein (c-di-GMP phosphodiesterase class II)